MKIKKIKITNFRSILETEFYPQEDMTALVGGNESGKSNVILALINFFSDKPYSDADKHQLSTELPEIIIEFSLSDEERKKISDISRSKVGSDLIIKKTKAGRVIENIKFELSIKSKKDSAPELINQEIPVNNMVSNENIETDASTQPQRDSVEEIQQDVEPQKPIAKTEGMFPTEQIFKMLPNLVAVLSVDDLIIGKDVAIKDLISAKDSTTGALSTINAFLELGEINLNKVKGTKTLLSQKTKHLIRGASLIGKKLREYWPQEDLKISITTDRKNISIHIRDGGCLPPKPNLKSNLSPEEILKIQNSIELREDDTRWIWTNPDERSNGFRWFATFFAKYLSKVDASHETILVIDDLGVFLNASIQEVLYQKLLALSSKNLQLIYTTHSPYMVDFSETKKVLLVEKKENGTNVIEEWWKKKSLKELPQPLKDIGLSRSENILKAKNLLVEGATDIAVIRRLTDLFSIDIEVTNAIGGVNMYPTGGSGESIGVALYCRVDNKKSAILFDSDPDALALNQKAQTYDLLSRDVSSLSKPYESSKFNMESIEDLIPDNLIIDALNVVGKEILKDKWVNIGNVHRKSGNNILGIIPTIRKRLEAEGYEDTNIDLVLGSKKAILESSLSNLAVDVYNPERKKAVENFLKNLAVFISSID